MSLFDTTASNMGSAVNNARSSIMGAAKEIGSEINSAKAYVSDAASHLTDGLNTATGGIFKGGVVGSMASSAAMSAASKYVPSSVNKLINNSGKIGGKLMSGDLLGAAGGLLNTGILNGVLGKLAGPLKQARYWATPTPLFGGISPAMAKAMHQESTGIEYAKKNLFIIEVSSLIGGDFSSRFNMLASSVEYSPATITGNKIKIGGATTDSVQSSEPTELSITTLDDSNGSIKAWFNDHAHAVVSSDGTVGLPAYYAIKIKIVHAVIESSLFSLGAYEDIGLYRPASLSISLSRSEDALQEITMTFSQLDTFMAP